jgi:hypothetical protein
MTQDSQDILDLLLEIKHAKRELVTAQTNKEKALQEFKHVSDQYDQADRQYLNLLQVFEYCMHHDCDPAYAKLVMSDQHTLKPQKGIMRGTTLQTIAEASMTQPLPHSRTFKQKVVDWLLRN